MQLQTHGNKVLQCLLEHVARHHIPLAALEREHRLPSRHDVRHPRMPPDVRKPFVPRHHLIGESDPAVVATVLPLRVEAGVDHESRAGSYGYLDDEGGASVGEGAYSGSVEGDGELGFGGYLAEVGVDQDAVGV
eukprot:CAMPEP_0201645874 /NCGR_PEP_ID=MMETSP0493-20130528/32927_1 /ASSEMBLY_ACC=CAM_ASM_000838 /TAXON_ID=420259 /ORGANISM="Thalassiosira gravida, Strain GMp14c1" /LENGTH=133 /DNA_ID=CAMNT_0048120907 /DNA_START=619 /DNA_END=1020 /DNA_ORIENTATION=-